MAMPTAVTTNHKAVCSATPVTPMFCMKRTAMMYIEMPPANHRIDAIAVAGSNTPLGQALAAFRKARASMSPEANVKTNTATMLRTLDTGTPSGSSHQAPWRIANGRGPGSRWNT
jgi:hypothetical protein